MLKLQYFGHLVRKTDSLEKTLMLGKIEGGKRGQQRVRWLDGITDVMDMSLHKLLGESNGQGGLACCSLWGRKGDTTEQHLLHSELLIYPSLSPLVATVCFLCLLSLWVCFCLAYESGEATLFFYWPAVWLVQSWFPNQGSNLGPGSAGAKS